MPANLRQKAARAAEVEFGDAVGPALRRRRKYRYNGPKGQLSTKKIDKKAVEQHTGKVCGMRKSHAG